MFGGATWATAIARLPLTRGMMETRPPSFPRDRHGWRNCWKHRPLGGQRPMGRARAAPQRGEVIEQHLVTGQCPQLEVPHIHSPAGH